jgi:hypothetical protein
MLSSALQAMFRLVLLPPHLAVLGELKREFEQRTGRFGAGDSWFEARSGAFLDDALTTQGMARAIEGDLSETERLYVEPLERAHRGLFRASRAGNAWLIVDAWSGVELAIEEPDTGLRDALATASGYFDARVVGTLVGSEPEVTLMPGAVFHAEDATAAIDTLLPLAREREMTTTECLDALLRMDHALRSLSRVKAAFAYRAEALGGRR